MDNTAILYRTNSIILYMNLKLMANILSKYARHLIILTWLFTTILYLKIFGIVTHAEAEKYITEAQRFLNTATLSAPRYWFYSITIFIIAIALKIKIGLTGAFVLQSLLNLFAFLFFYNELKKIFQISLTAFFINIFLLIFWPYQSWVVYLYSESAFFSLILILFAVLIRYKPDSLKNILLISLALVLVILARPLGILFTASVYAYFFYYAGKKWKIILGIISALIAVFVFYVVNIIFSTITDWSIIKPFIQESIICDLPTTTPSNIKLDLAAGGMPIYQLYYYVTHNFFHFLHFCDVKLKYFFLMTRPYYSRSHNYFLLIFNLTVYLLFLGSFFIKQAMYSKKLNVFLLTSIAVYTLSIIFQCDDYHNRFILSIYPFFIILAAKTAEFIAVSFLKKKS